MLKFRRRLAGRLGTTCWFAAGIASISDCYLFAICNHFFIFFQSLLITYWDLSVTSSNLSSCVSCFRSLWITIIDYHIEDKIGSKRRLVRNERDQNSWQNTIPKDCVCDESSETLWCRHKCTDLRPQVLKSLYWLVHTFSCSAFDRRTLDHDLNFRNCDSRHWLQWTEQLRRVPRV